MSNVSSGQEAGTARLDLAVWHPECWTLEVTEDTDAGLVARGVYTSDGAVHARLTARGPSDAAVAQLVDAVDASSRTTEVLELTPRFEVRPPEPAGKATRELLVEYPDTNSIYEPFVERGFLPDEQIRIRGGTEYWTVVARGERPALQRRLDEVRASMNADVEVRGIASTDGEGHGTASAGAEEGHLLSTLSDRQREAVRLALRRGYYEWPREVSATELAAEFGVNKATYLEHLRKAEAKLLDALGTDVRR